MGERHAARSRGKIPFVQGFDFVEVLLERLPRHTRQDRVAVFNFRKLKLRTGRALIIRKFSLLQDDFGKCEESCGRTEVDIHHEEARSRERVGVE